MGGAGYIPWSVVREFAALASLTSADECDLLWRMIHSMDGAYLEWLAEKQKAPPKK